VESGPGFSEGQYRCDRQREVESAMEKDSSCGGAAELVIQQPVLWLAAVYTAVLLDARQTDRLTD